MITEISGEEKVFSFSTGDDRSGITRADCRIDIYDISDLTTLVSHRNERTWYDRQCVFPAYKT